jgi:hypothetical protein
VEYEPIVSGSLALIICLVVAVVISQFVGRTRSGSVPEVGQSKSKTDQVIPQETMHSFLGKILLWLGNRILTPSEKRLHIPTCIWQKTKRLIL